MSLNIRWLVIEFERLIIVVLFLLRWLVVSISRRPSAMSFHTREQHLTAERVFDEILQLARDVLRTAGRFGFFGLWRFWRGVAHVGR